MNVRWLNGQRCRLVRMGTRVRSQPGPQFLRDFEYDFKFNFLKFN